jgi:hypothetical protein
MHVMDAKKYRKIYGSAEERIISAPAAVEQKGHWRQGMAAGKRGG